MTFIPGRKEERPMNSAPRLRLRRAICQIAGIPVDSIRFSVQSGTERPATTPPRDVLKYTVCRRSDYSPGVLYPTSFRRYTSSIIRRPKKEQVANTPDYREALRETGGRSAHVWEGFLFFGTRQQRSKLRWSLRNFQGSYLSPQQAEGAEWRSSTKRRQP